MLPEQIWDAADLPDNELYYGKPSGSAMPLVWAHSEYLKLCRSLATGGVFDMPPQTVARYQGKTVTCPFTVWAFNHKIRTFPKGKILRLVLPAPARVRWHVDGRTTYKESPTQDSTLTVHHVDLPTSRLRKGTVIHFRIFWPDEARWEDTEYIVEIT